MKIQNHKADLIVIFVALALCLVTFLMATSIANRRDKEQFCNIIEATLVVPALKPVDPLLHPGEEEQYLIHQKYMELAQIYNCTGDAA